MEEIVSFGPAELKRYLVMTSSLYESLRSIDEGVSWLQRVYTSWTGEECLSSELAQTGETLLSELQSVISDSRRLLTLLEQRK